MGHFVGLSVGWLVGQKNILSRTSQKESLKIFNLRQGASMGHFVRWLEEKKFCPGLAKKIIVPKKSLSNFFKAPARSFSISLCWSVGRSVGWLVGWSSEKNCGKFLLVAFQIFNFNLALR